VNVLIAGFGNIFRSDDGLGSQVIRLLANENLGPNVRICDFGTGGMHLALEMLAGYDRIVIVDAVGRDVPPGTTFAIACDPREFTNVSGAPDPHGMDIAGLLHLYFRLRERCGEDGDPEIFVAGCVPQSLDDGMELSEAVKAALPACVDLVRRLTTKTVTGVQS
jgi:hydrogenase maturation protease